MSESVNPVLQKTEDLFKSLVWDPMVSAELSALYASNAWMNVWPIRQIIDGLSKLVTDSFFGKFKLVADLGAISLLNSEHKSAFDKAAVTLKIVAQDKGIDSEEYRNAKEDAKAALSKFVRYNI